MLAERINRALDNELNGRGAEQDQAADDGPQERALGSLDLLGIPARRDEQETYIHEHHDEYDRADLHDAAEDGVQELRERVDVLERIRQASTSGIPARRYAAGRVPAGRDLRLSDPCPGEREGEKSEARCEGCIRHKVI